MSKTKTNATTTTAAKKAQPATAPSKKSTNTGAPRTVGEPAARPERTPSAAKKQTAVYDMPASVRPTQPAPRTSTSYESEELESGHSGSNTPDAAAAATKVKARKVTAKAVIAPAVAAAATGIVIKKQTPLPKTAKKRIEREVALSDENDDEEKEEEEEEEEELEQKRATKGKKAPPQKNGGLRKSNGGGDQDSGVKSASAEDDGRQSVHSSNGKGVPTKKKAANGNGTKIPTRTRPSRHADEEPSYTGTNGGSRQLNGNIMDYLPTDARLLPVGAAAAADDDTSDDRFAGAQYMTSFTFYHDLLIQIAGSRGHRMIQIEERYKDAGGVVIRYGSLPKKPIAWLSIFANSKTTSRAAVNDTRAILEEVCELAPLPNGRPNRYIMFYCFFKLPSLQPAPVPLEPPAAVHVFMDLSNLVVPLVKFATKNKGLSRPANQIIDDALTQGRPCATKMISSSRQMQNERAWSEWVDLGWQSYTQEATGKEEATDDVLHAMINALILKSERPGVLVIGSGDGNANSGRCTFPDCARAALKRGWKVDVVAWHDSLSKKMFYPLQSQYPATMSIRLLDAYFMEE